MGMPINLAALRPDTLAALELLARKKLQLEAIRAQQQQERVAKEFGEANAVDGIGELQMQVHAQAYHEWNAKQPGCWSDPAFRRWYRKKQAPETDVKCGGTKVQVGWTPSAPQTIEIFGCQENKRFTKKY
jgi:hypothetical protein